MSGRSAGGGPLRMQACCRSTWGGESPTSTARWALPPTPTTPSPPPGRPGRLSLSACDRRPRKISSTGWAIAAATIAAGTETWWMTGNRRGCSPSSRTRSVPRAIVTERCGLGEHRRRRGHHQRLHGSLLRGCPRRRFRLPLHPAALAISTPSLHAFLLMLLRPQWRRVWMRAVYYDRDDHDHDHSDHDRCDP